MGKLISLELFNFKSYKGSVSIKLGAADFVSIIGPNGSGKSNIMDAISFVLGVNNDYLRSSSLLQLIYRGKNNLNEDDSVEDPETAFVEAHYQKNNGEIIIFHRDVHISGSSSFKIDQKKVDFKFYVDSLEKENILVHVRNFLVFQGDVEKVASKNPQDLTDFFEQISGSIKYKNEYDNLKTKYSEAESKCAESILEKRRLQNELVHYKESVMKDEKYALKFDEKNHLWEQYYLWQLSQVEDSLKSISNKEELIAIEIKQEAKLLAEKEKDLQLFKSGHVELELDLSTKETEIKKLDKKIKKLKTKDLIKLSKTKKTHLEIVGESEERDNLLKNDLGKQFTRLKDLNNQLSSFNEEKSVIEKNLKEILSENIKYQSLTIADLNDINNLKAVYFNDFNGSELDKEIQLKINSLDEKKSQQRKVNNQIAQVKLLISDLETKLQEKVNQINSHQETVKILEAEKKQQAGLIKKFKNKTQTLKKKVDFDNVKLRNTLIRLDELAAYQRDSANDQRLKENCKKLEKFFPGVKGFVIDLFRPSSKKYNQAVSLIIGRHTHSIVVDTAITATQCISFMKEQRMGVATFLPLDTINGISPGFTLSGDDAVFANDILISGPEYITISRYLCGDTIISDSLEVSQRLRWKENYNCRIISLTRSVIQKSGVMTGGVAGSNANEGVWNKIEYQDLNTTKDDLLSSIDKSQVQIQSLKDEGKQCDNIFVKNAESIIKFEELIASEENAKSQLIKQIEYNKNTIENEYSKELIAIQLDIGKINNAYAELTQKKDKIQESLFKDLSLKLGFSVLEYEKTTGYVLKEKKKQLNIITRDILQLQSKLTFEEQKKAQIENSIFDLNKIIENSDQILNDIETNEANLNKKIEEYESELKSAQDQLENFRNTFKNEIDKIESLVVEVNASKQSLDQILSTQFTYKTEIDFMLEQRFSILKNCRMNAIDIPLKNNISFGDIKLEYMQDVDEFFVDYKKLDKNLLKDKKKQLSEKEIDAQFQQNIAIIEEELVSLQPNAHAHERLAEIQAKFDDYNANVVSDLKQKEKKLLAEFNTIKSKRTNTFLETFNYVVDHIDAVYKELTTDSHNTNNLLSGGSAKLTIDYSDEADADEPYICGLKYQATPPLKKFKEIEYLSGGEKTVAALALLFTVNSFKPSPFFILDEIDAALDSVNVYRVSNYIKTHAKKDLQFIVISLKNSIYEESDALVGVYRDQSVNASRILTLDLSQYE
ncbi:hypothetical protein QEN19_003864 [Hanseniaspora menglaensis]